MGVSNCGYFELAAWFATIFYLDIDNSYPHAPIRARLALSKFYLTFTNEAISYLSISLSNKKYKSNFK